MQNKIQNLNQTGKNVLYVSDLPTNVTESELAMFFKDYRDNILVISFQMIQEMHDSVKLGSCFSKHLFDGNRFE